MKLPIRSTRVYGAQALDDVSKGYDALVTSQALGSELPAASGMIFRNTPTIRERMRTLVLEIGKWAVYLPGCVACEEVTLLARAFPVLPFESRLANDHFASAQAVWDDGLLKGEVVGLIGGIFIGMTY